MVSRVATGVHMEQPAGKFNRASTVGVSSYHSSSQSANGHLLQACIACKQSITAPHTDTIHQKLKIKCEDFSNYWCQPITDVSHFLTTPSQLLFARVQHAGQPIISLGIYDKQTGLSWFFQVCQVGCPPVLVVSYWAQQVGNAPLLPSVTWYNYAMQTLLAARRHNAAKVPDSKVKCSFTLLLGQTMPFAERFWNLKLAGAAKSYQ